MCVIAGANIGGLFVPYGAMASSIYYKLINPDAEFLSPNER